MDRHGEALRPWEEGKKPDQPPVASAPCRSITSHRLAVTTPESPSQNHSAKPFQNSPPTEIMSDNKRITVILSHWALEHFLCACTTGIVTFPLKQEKYRSILLDPFRFPTHPIIMLVSLAFCSGLTWMCLVEEGGVSSFYRAIYFLSYEIIFTFHMSHNRSIQSIYLDQSLGIHVYAIWLRSIYLLCCFLSFNPPLPVWDSLSCLYFPFSPLYWSRNYLLCFCAVDVALKVSTYILDVKCSVTQ